MKVLCMYGDKIRFEGNDYIEETFMVDLYKEYLKSTRSLIDLSINYPNDIYPNIALRLKKGEKLEMIGRNPPRLTIFDINLYNPRLKYKKYVYMSTYFIGRNDDDYFLSEAGYNFGPMTKTWYKEEKLLNEKNLKLMVDEYLNELNQELSRFENMVSYTEYDYPKYYGFGGTSLKKTYKEIMVNGKLMKVTKQCIDYIKSNNFTEAEANEIIFDDILNKFVETY